MLLRNPKEDGSEEKLLKDGRLPITSQGYCYDILDVESHGKKGLRLFDVLSEQDRIGDEGLYDGPEPDFHVKALLQGKILALLLPAMQGADQCSDHY